MSNFAFLESEWRPTFEAASRAEALVHPDPRAACFYARRTLELVVKWVYAHDRDVKLPYQEHLSALIHEPSFREVAGPAVFAKAKLLKDLGNQAVHSKRPIRQYDALTAVRELFHVCFWMARTYAQDQRPSDDLRFDQALIPKDQDGSPQTLAELQSLQQQLEERDEKLADLLAGRDALDEELKSLRLEVAKARRANEAVPDTHDYSEAETRDYFIDLLLREAGWPLDQKRDREFPVTGMPNQTGQGFVDYVLWGDDGLPLALVEAKRTRHDARKGRQQAKLYADCLEAPFGRRPIIFYTNGYEHWIWDDTQHPPREVQGFYKKDELELTIQRRKTRRSLAKADVNTDIAGRHYQTRAIRRIAESFEVDNQRKALLVMATGAGKTRTVIALCDLLLRCNWAKRILFLADRVALVNQAVGAFKSHLPDAAPVNLVTERDGQGRVYVSTYPTMMGLINDAKGDRRRFGVGHFDVVIIDEAHRSVYQKYRAIFEYFDSYLVGLTATPKDEIDRNTYSLFDLESGVPTDAYGLDEAVDDGFLVPPRTVSVPLKFQREGINYDDLSEEEKDEWDALEWSDEGDVPDRVEAEAVNRWLFNEDTVDRVLKHLMQRGQKVAGGDRLGKTIIFAKNNAHAHFIAKRFDANYPRDAGHFARVITYREDYAQSLIDEFSKPDEPPHIAISVDMLDTGIDIPEVVNLVFFKLVRSKTKFWQMLGRGTRLRPDLFGPGRDKEFFYVFDYCQNLEYFSQDPPTVDGATGKTLSERLFTTRLELIAALDRRERRPGAHEPPAPMSAEEREHELRRQVAEALHEYVGQMDLNNFIVRPQRRFVEKFEKEEAWRELSDLDLGELAEHVAGLPSQVADDGVEAKLFDMVILRLQLSVLSGAAGFDRNKRIVQGIAARLAEMESIPMVRDQMVLIQELLTDEYWADITAPMLEIVRRRLRSLVRLIEKEERRIVYTSFEDELGEEKPIDLPAFNEEVSYERFRKKTRAFLREHIDHPALQKVRSNWPLTSRDIEKLERLLIQAGGTPEHVSRAREDSHGLGLFIRSLVGLDRAAAKQAFAEFLDRRPQTAAQIEFVNLIINHLTERGYMDPAALYQSPFTEISPRGPEGLFKEQQVRLLITTLNDVKARATTAA